MEHVDKIQDERSCAADVARLTLLLGITFILLSASAWFASTGDGREWTVIGIIGGTLLVWWMVALVRRIVVNGRNR